MSDFTYQPVTSNPPSIKSNPRVLSAKFGDGYEQRTPDGINANLRTWSLVFRTTDASVASSIDSFLAGKAGVTSFTWTPSGESEVTVVCRNWTRTRYDWGQEISAEFEEVAA